MITRKTDQQLADVVGYMITCCKGLDEHKAKVDIEAWYNENDAKENIPHWGRYMSIEISRDIKRGIAHAAQDSVTDQSGCSLKALAHVLNKAGDSWISDEEMQSNLCYLAWCLRCLSIPDFVEKYVKAYGDSYSDEATRLVTAMFRDSNGSKSTCYLVETAATLVDDVAAYMRCIHALNPRS